jgi:hypothetical protein
MYGCREGRSAVVWTSASEKVDERAERICSQLEVTVPLQHHDERTYMRARQYMAAPASRHRGNRLNRPISRGYSMAPRFAGRQGRRGCRSARENEAKEEWRDGEESADRKTTRK